ncbi:MAG: hypothetical protein ACXQTS_06000 [Candidatus Methanospirareceae archaeon]
MSRSPIRSGRSVVTNVTINAPIKGSVEDVAKLVRLMYRFRDCVKGALPLVRGGVEPVRGKTVMRGFIGNTWYAYSACCEAKLILRGLKATDGDYASIGKPFLVSSGDRSRRGNRNIRLLSVRELEVLYPFGGRGEFLRFSVKFPGKFIPLVEELIDLAGQGRASYGVIISLKRGLVAHVSVPLELWLRHMRKKDKPFGSNVASVDINSDRMNLVVITPDRELIYRKTFWYPEVNSPGYPGGRANYKRFQGVNEVIEGAYYYGASVMVLEDMYRMKGRNFRGSARANRKISRFPKRRLPEHIILESLEWGIEPYLIRMAYSSSKGRELAREYGFDIHTGSALALALRFLKYGKLCSTL